jgi:hypothetical protein
MASQSASSRPDQETARLVLSSCRSLADREAELTERFCLHLDRVTGAGPVGNGSHGAVRGGRVPGVGLTPAELLRSILSAVTSTADPAVIERRWQELGARAAQAGATGDGFAPVGQALVRAVRDLSGDAWSSSISSGWTAFHVWMAEHLSAGALAADVVAAGGVYPPERTSDQSESSSATSQSDASSATGGLPPGPSPRQPGQVRSGEADRPWNRVD